MVPEEKRREILRIIRDSLGLGRMEPKLVEKLIGKLNFFQMYAVGRIMRYTFPIMYTQLYSGIPKGKLSTQFAQVLREWEIIFSRPVEREIRFTDSAKYIIYTDASSIQGGSIGGCLITVANCTQVNEFSTKVPLDLARKKRGRKRSHQFAGDIGGGVRHDKIPTRNRGFERGVIQRQ